MKIFRDPVHNVIDLDTGDEAVNDLIIRLIDSREFQRLRYIRQLGFVYLAYPSGVHTRFEHSIGVAFLAKRFLEKIISLESKVIQAHNGYKRQLLADFFTQVKNEKNVTIIAALLHDVGHGPFSHVFEEITGISHEKWVKEIILGPTEINAELLNFHPAYPKMICDLLFHTNKSPSAHFIAGQLDIDKIDYLLRDSHMTGSGYGKFDVEWLFNVLTVGIVENKVVIGLDQGKGLSVAEDFIMARTYMFRNVYLHKTTQIAQSMLALLLKRMKDLDGGIGLFPSESLRRILLLQKDTGSLSDYVADYTAISDIDLLYLLRLLIDSKDAVLRRLSRGLLERRYYKKVDAQKWQQLEAELTDAIGSDMASYYMLKINPKTDKIIYHPEEDSIVLFNKYGGSVSLHEISAIMPTKRKDAAVNTEYYVDYEIFKGKNNS